MNVTITAAADTGSGQQPGQFRGFPVTADRRVMQHGDPFAIRPVQGVSSRQRKAQAAIPGPESGCHPGKKRESSGKIQPRQPQIT